MTTPAEGMDDEGPHLLLQVCKATGIHVEADVQVYIRFGRLKFRTKAVKASKEPSWAEYFDLGPFDNVEDIKFACVCNDELVGLVSVPTKEAITAKPGPHSFVLIKPPDSDDEDSDSDSDSDSGSGSGSGSGSDSEEGDKKGDKKEGDGEKPASKGPTEVGHMLLEFTVDDPKKANKKRGFFAKLWQGLRGKLSKARKEAAEEERRRQLANKGEYSSDDDSDDDSDSGSGSDDGSGSRSRSGSGSGSGSESSPRTSPRVVEMKKEEEEPGLLFGRLLEDVLAYQREKYPEHADLEIPMFIDAAARYIRSTGNITTMGLFRVRGRIAQIKELKRKLNTGDELNLDDVINIHNITSLIKTFLRELPVPLLTFELYVQFLKCADKSGEARDKAIVRTIQKLPDSNRKLLLFLLELMYDISQHKETNKMTAENLGKVLAPNLLWKETVNISDLTQLIDMKKANDITESMIIQFHDLFSPGAVARILGDDDSGSESSDISSIQLTTSEDISDDEGGADDRGGLDDLIARMKKGKFRAESTGDLEAAAPSDKANRPKAGAGAGGKRFGTLNPKMLQGT